MSPTAAGFLLVAILLAAALHSLTPHASLMPAGGYGVATAFSHAAGALP